MIQLVDDMYVVYPYGSTLVMSLPDDMHVVYVEVGK